MCSLAEKSICQGPSPSLCCWSVKPSAGLLELNYHCSRNPATPLTRQTLLAVPAGEAASFVINRRGKQNSQIATCDFPYMAFLFANFGNKLTCDPGREGQLNSHWPEKINQGVLGEAEQGTGSALCVGRDFLYLFCRDRQHLDVEDSTVSRAVRHLNSRIAH